MEFGILHFPVWAGFGGMHFEGFWNCDRMGGRLALRGRNLLVKSVTGVPPVEVE